MAGDVFGQSKKIEVRVRVARWHQKSQFGYILEGLGIEHLWPFM
jgi:hypothetical protein